MATSRLNLTRDQLATFLKDHEQIRQFERLFAAASELVPTTVQDLTIAAGNADQKAVQALDALNRIANALEMLAAAPVIQNNNSVVTDYIDLNDNPPHLDQARRIVWNNVDQTADLGLEYGVIQQIGQEMYARVGNTTGSIIPNGTVVGFAGATTNAILVAPYLANGSQPSLYILGVMTHDLPDSGQTGYCTVWGFVRDVDTSAFNPGDILYASPTVAGGLTNIKPTAPDNVIPLAACVSSDASNGVIFVRPTIEQQKYYGKFARNATYVAASAGVAYSIPFDTTQISNGIAIGSPTSRIVVSNSGLYQFDITAQISSSNSSAKTVGIWVKKNGTEVQYSRRLVTIAINGGFVPLSFSQFLSLQANDYIEIVFYTNDVAAYLDNVGIAPGIPSAAALTLLVTQIQQ